jgi:hypothetical protein
MQPVSAMTRDERCSKTRDELKKSDKPEIPYARCEVVHMPADRQHQHLLSGNGTDACDQKARKR